MKSRVVVGIVLVLACAAITAPARGQGFIVCPGPLPPVPPRPFAVSAHQVDVQIECGDLLIGFVLTSTGLAM